VRGALVLGRLAVMRNDIASAQKWADEAAALSADDKMVQSGLHMLHGDVLARLGRAPEAEKELLEEIRLYPATASTRGARSSSSSRGSPAPRRSSSR
jgi:Flp pilus assembly protein TadD